MFFYGVSVLALIPKLKDPNNVLQSWYADDSAAIAKLQKLEIWLKNLIEESAPFGYFPEPSKSFLIVDKQYAEEAHHIFDKYSITIVEAKKFLGGFIGDGNEKDIYLKKKELEWVDKIEKLSFVAKTEPQCALSGLTKSLQAEWNFPHRVLGGSSQLFQPLENLLMEKFLPAVLFPYQWRDVSFVCQQERVVLECLTQPVSLMSLTTRHGKQLRFFMMLLFISTVFPMTTTESKCLNRGKTSSNNGRKT